MIFIYKNFAEIFTIFGLRFILNTPLCYFYHLA